jgi:hypothetical protein
MPSIIKEKLAVCYSCSGESYRESALRQIEQNYFDDDNIFYFIVTDDKSYFNEVKRKNLIVNELKDFYSEFPLLEKYEALIESTDKNDYAKKFVESRYLYSFSLMRFHLLQAYRYGIQNVSVMCTDTNINFEIFNDDFFNIKNTIYNAVSEWDSNIKEKDMNLVRDYLQEKYNMNPSETVRVLDAAGRFFVFDTLDTLYKFFNTWNDVITYLYESDYMKRFGSTYVYHDEYILAPIYNVFGLNKREVHSTSRMFNVNHNQIKERFWRLGGSNPGLMEHTNYEEFLRINNLSNG